MYTNGEPLGAFDLKTLFQRAETAVQKIQSTAQKVKQSAEQFLPAEAVSASPAPSPTGAVPISAARAAEAPLMPSGFPVLPLVIGGGVLLFWFLRRRKK